MGIDLRWKTARGRTNFERLQHPERVYPPLSLETSWRYANLCKDSDWKNHYPRSRAIRHYRKRQVQDPGQRRNSTRSATIDLRWQTTRGRSNFVRLQHPERVNFASRPPTQGRDANFRQDLNRKDDYPRS